MKLLTFHPFRSGREHNRKWLDAESASKWFLDLLAGAKARGAYVCIRIRADQIYDVLEVSLVKIGANIPRYYELGRLTRTESSMLLREYDEYRRMN